MGPQVAPALSQVTSPQPRRGASMTTASEAEGASVAPSFEETTDWSLHEAMAAATISILNKANEGACILRSFRRARLLLNPTMRLFQRALERFNPAMRALSSMAFNSSK
jgi:hypothetical protein